MLIKISSSKTGIIFHDKLLLDLLAYEYYLCLCGLCNQFAGDEQCSMGYVVPTITVLKKKLMKVEVRHKNPLRNCLLKGIEDRFGKVMNDKEFLLAAVSHPRFKLAWTDDLMLRAHCTQLFEQAMLSCTPISSTSDTDISSSSEEPDDFFNFTNSRTDVAQSQKYLEYLKDSSTDLSMLNKHPEVKQLFIRYNTCIPSSAPVERLFSTGALVLTKRRNRLSDKLFETLLMLKINKAYW